MLTEKEVEYAGAWRPYSCPSPGMELLVCRNPKEPFWILWRLARHDVASLGVSVEKYDGQWMAWWRRKTRPLPPPIVTPGDWVDDLGPQVSKELQELLLPWQPPIVAQLAATLSRWGGALDASGTGVGKTTAALAASRTLGFKHTVIICPVSVVPNWKDWGRRFGVDVMPIGYEKVVRGTGNVPWLQRYGDRFSWTVPRKREVLLVFDEAHRIGGLDTLISKVARSAHQAGVPVLALSATLADNPMRMSAIGLILGMFPHDGFWKWAAANGCAEGKYGWDFSGSTAVLADIHRHIFGCGLGVRLSPEDIPGFPSLQITVRKIQVANPNKIRKAIARMGELARESGRLGRDASRGGEYVQLARIIELEKLPAVVEMADDAADEGNCAIVFTHFRESAEAAAEALSCRLIIGAQSQADRQEILKDLRENRLKRLVATEGCGSEAVDMDDQIGNLPRKGITNPSGSSRLLRQTCGRIRRAQSKSKALLDIVIAADTPEEEMAEKLAQKLSQMDALLDGDLLPFSSDDAAALAALAEESQ